MIGRQIGEYVFPAAVVIDGTAQVEGPEEVETEVSKTIWMPSGRVE